MELGALSSKIVYAREWCAGEDFCDTVADDVPRGRESGFDDGEIGWIRGVEGKLNS